MRTPAREPRSAAGPDASTPASSRSDAVFPARVDAADLRERIPIGALTFVHSRSSGPGGQNVNKLSTRVTLLFALRDTVLLSPADIRRVRGRLAGRISKEGILRVSSSRFRTQRANRDATVERFYELLAEALAPPPPRTPTSVPRREKRRRLVDKLHRGERKKLRSGIREHDG
jgi:ribosome-associated protein